MICDASELFIFAVMNYCVDIFKLLMKLLSKLLLMNSFTHGSLSFWCYSLLLLLLLLLKES